MSVLTHLKELSSNLNIAEKEAESIATSIAALERRLDLYFGANIKEKFRFGSSLRRTMLPGNADRQSDVDYMVVFENALNLKPNTFLRRLRGFAEYYYSSSDIYSSHPTVVLELNHIKFDLVPSYRDYSALKIPAPSSHYEDWMFTYPYSLNQEMDKAHQASGYELKPALRLIKYWNALNGYVYPSFAMESEMIYAGYSFFANLKECFYLLVDRLYNSRLTLPEYKRAKIERLKNIVDNTRKYERDNMPISAESEIKKVLPYL